MDIQLIFNEDIVKSLCPIPANIAGEFMASAMFEAQEIHLKAILGNALLARLKELEAQETWNENPKLRILKEKCQLYLAYKTISELIPKVSYHISNKGAVSTSDEKIQNLSRFDIDSMIEDYNGKADFFCAELQRFILDNYCDYDDILDNEQCEAIRSNLRSATTCGIWLGGAFGV